MTKIGIQNPKLIVTNDYVSDVKPGLLPVKLKVSKNGIFWAKSLSQKNFPRLFLSPNQSYVKKQDQNGPPPSATQDAFQRLPLVGVVKNIYWIIYIQRGKTV